MADHKSWLLSCKSNEVSESVKTSVKGKTELKTTKRLIFTWSFRKLVSEAIMECGLRPLLVLSAVTVGRWDGGWLSMKLVDKADRPGNVATIHYHPGSCFPLVLRILD